MTLKEIVQREKAIKSTWDKATPKERKDKGLQRPTITNIVMTAIDDLKLDESKGKEHGLEVIKAVREVFTKARFDLRAYFWFISRFKRQEHFKLGTDHLYVVKGSRVHRGKAKKASTASKAKKGVRKAKKAKKTQPAKTQATV